LSQMEGTSAYDTGQAPVGSMTFQDSPIFGSTNRDKVYNSINTSIIKLNSDKTTGGVPELRERIKGLIAQRETSPDWIEISKTARAEVEADSSLDTFDVTSRLKGLKIEELEAEILAKKQGTLGSEINRYLGTFDWDTMFSGTDNALKNHINTEANDPTFVDSFKDGASTPIPTIPTFADPCPTGFVLKDGVCVAVESADPPPDANLDPPPAVTAVDLDGLDIFDLGDTNFSGYGLPNTLKYLYDAEEGTVKEGVSITRVPGSNKVTIKYNNNSETGNNGVPDGEPMTYEITYGDDGQSNITGLRVNGQEIESNQWLRGFSHLQQFKNPDIIDPPVPTGVSFAEDDISAAISVIGDKNIKTNGEFDPVKIKKIIRSWANNRGSRALKDALGPTENYERVNMPAFIDKIIESLGGTVEVSSNNDNGEVQLASAEVSESLLSKLQKNLGKLKNNFTLQAAASNNPELKKELEEAGIKFDTSMDESATSVAGEKQRLDTEELIAAVKAGDLEKANLLALQIEESRDEERAFVAPPSSTVTEETSFSGSSDADNAFITDATRARMAKQALATEVTPTIDDDLRRDMARNPAELANLLAAVREGNLERANIIARQIEEDNILAQQIAESRDVQTDFTAPAEGESPVSSTMGPVSVDTTTPNISQTGLARKSPSVNVSEDTLPQFTDAPGLGARRIDIDASPLNTESPVSPRFEKFVQVIAETIKPKSTLGRAQRDNKLKVNNSQLRTLIEKQLQKDGVLPSPYSSSMKPKERKLIIDQHAEAYIASRVEEVAN